MRQAAAAVPHAAELVGVQLAFVLVGSVCTGPPLGVSSTLPDVGGPGVVVEVGADLDDVLADEGHRRVMVGQAVIVADALPDRGDRVQTVGDVVSFLVADGGQDALAFVHRAKPFEPQRHEDTKTLMSVQ